MAAVIPGMQRWANLGERALWLRTSKSEYAPVLGTLDLSDTALIDNIRDRIDLRRLFPLLLGNIPMIPCINHRDTHHPSMGVNRTYVKCFTCGYCTGYETFIDAVCRPQTKRQLYSIIRYLLGGVEVAKTTELKPIPHSSVERAVNLLKTKYLDRRAVFTKRYGVDAETQGAFELGFTGSEFSFPVYSAGGDIVNIRYRKDWTQADSGGPRYWSKKGYGKTSFFIPPNVRGADLYTGYVNTYGLAADGTRRVAWVEGELGVMALHQLGIASVSTTNGCGAVSEEKFPLEDLMGLTVAVCFDADEPGAAAAVIAVDRLLGLGISCYTVTVPRVSIGSNAMAKDVTDLLSHADWGRPDFVRLLRGDR